MDRGAERVRIVGVDVCAPDLAFGAGGLQGGGCEEMTGDADCEGAVCGGRVGC